MRALPLSLTLSLALLSGCSMMPDYQRPQVDAANSWTSTASANQPAAETAWQTIIQDPALRQVIDQALLHNLDLRTALLNVERYRAQYRIQRAALLPSVKAGIDGSRQRLPQTYTGGDASVSSQYSATLGFSAWELDLFGRVRSLKQQALESYLAQQEAARSTQLTLVASVANAYLDWVADREQLSLAQQTRAIEQDNLSLVRKRYELGVASELELSQAQAAFEDAQVRLAQYNRLVRLDRSALGLLVGAPLPAGWQPAAQLANVAISPVAPGLASELLNRRPDLRAAEHRLKAANANIGAARAAFFPSISLTATAGSLSSDLSNLFDANSGSWLFAPSLSLPLFNAGRLDAQLDTAEVDRDLALTSYEQAVQTAFTEVADALTQQAGYGQQLASQEQAEAAYARYFEIADQRYHNGVDSMLTRLDAQRNLVASQQASISARLALLQAQVDLYRALGGGWQEAALTSR